MLSGQADTVKRERRWVKCVGFMREDVYVRDWYQNASVVDHTEKLGSSRQELVCLVQIWKDLTCPFPSAMVNTVVIWQSMWKIRGEESPAKKTHCLFVQMEAEINMVWWDWCIQLDTSISLLLDQYDEFMLLFLHWMNRRILLRQCCSGERFVLNCCHGHLRGSVLW